MEVLDACVLIPAALRDTLLRCAAEGMYRPVWSEEILAEVARNLVAHGMTTQAQADGLVSTLRSEFEDAEVTGHQLLIASMTNHPKDRHVVAAAIEAGADVIVTYNLRDFPPKSVEPHGIEVQHPDAFLVDGLFDLDPAGMCDVIRGQSADLKNPPLSPWQLLDILERQAPRFAARVRSSLLEMTSESS